MDNKPDLTEDKMHSFSRVLAKEYGIPEAVLLQYLHARIKSLKAKDSARSSVFVTLDDMAETYPYLGRTAIYNALKRLRERAKPALATARHNKKRYDRTTWYSIADPMIPLKVDLEPLYFSRNDAKEFGIVAAVLLENIAYWVSHNRVTDPSYEWHWMSPYQLSKVLKIPRTTVAAALKALEGKELERRQIEESQDFEYRLIDTSRLDRWNDRHPPTCQEVNITSPNQNVTDPNANATSQNQDGTSQKVNDNTPYKIPYKKSLEESLKESLRDKPTPPSVALEFGTSFMEGKTVLDKTIGVMLCVLSTTDRDGNPFFQWSDKALVMAYNWFYFNREFAVNDILILLNECYRTHQEYHFDHDYEHSKSNEVLIRSKNLHYFFGNMEKVMQVTRFAEWKETARYRPLPPVTLKTPVPGDIWRKLKASLAEELPHYNSIVEEMMKLPS